MTYIGSVRTLGASKATPSPFAVGQGAPTTRWPAWMPLVNRASSMRADAPTSSITPMPESTHNRDCCGKRGWAVQRKLFRAAFQRWRHAAHLPVLALPAAEAENPHRGLAGRRCLRG